MSPNQMHVKKSRTATSERGSGAIRQQVTPVSLLTDLKERLREQICEHPGEALKIGLLTGIFAGWWVKR